MITFGNIALLSKVVANCFITQIGELGSAPTQIWIEQLGQSITLFKTVEPSRSVFKYYYIDNDSSIGEIGTKFLVDYASFKQKVSIINGSNYSSVTLCQQNSIPRLRTDYRIHNGKPTEKSNVSLKPYQGSLEDFQELSPPKPDELFCTVDAHHWSKIVDTFQKFGNFSSDKFENSLVFSRLISVEINVQKNSMQWFSNSKDAYGTYTSYKCPININHENNAVLAFEGRLLNKLKNISSDAPVNIYLYGDLICFKSDLGEIIVKATQVLGSQKRDEKLFEFPLTTGQFHSQRKLSFPVLLSSINMSSLFSSSSLLIYEDGRLILSQSENLSIKEEAYVDISPEGVIGDFEPLLSNALAFQLISKALRISSSENNECTFTQYKVPRKQGDDIWILYISFRELTEENEIICAVLTRSGFDCIKELEIE